MKKYAVAAVLLLVLSVNAYSQIESGDKEISFMGYFSTRTGEDVDPNGYGSLQLSYGRYYGRNLEIGIAPILSFSTVKENGEQKIETQWSGSVFFNLNLASASKIIPYLTGRYYQYTFDIPDNADFSDYSYVTVGGGIKSFFNEYAALNTLVTYGFSPNTDNEGGVVMIMTGLSFIF